MTVRVLMLGPGDAVVGGVSTLAHTIVPALREKVSLHYMPTVRQRLPGECGKISPRNIALAMSQYVRFLRAVRRFQPDIVHIHTSRGIAWLKDTFFIMMSKACNRKVVLHIHGGDFNEFLDNGTWILRYYTRVSLNLSDAIIAVSAELKERLARTVPGRQIQVLRNCIAVDHYECRTFSHSAHRTTALFMGRIGASKGTLDLLRSMSRLKSRGVPLHLWLAGGEQRKGDLHMASSLLKELDLEDTCQLIGEVGVEKRSQLLGEADLFVLPSYHEGLPMAILEAMAAGLAVVATPVGGIPEVVRDGYNGFLIPAGDIDVLADRLSLLACDSDLREAMGRRSRGIVEQELGTKQYTQRLAALYGSLTVTGGKG